MKRGMVTLSVVLGMAVVVLAPFDRGFGARVMNDTDLSFLYGGCSWYNPNCRDEGIGCPTIEPDCSKPLIECRICTDGGKRRWSCTYEWTWYPDYNGCDVDPNDCDPGGVPGFCAAGAMGCIAGEGDPNYTPPCTGNYDDCDD